MGAEERKKYETEKIAKEREVAEYKRALEIEVPPLLLIPMLMCCDSCCRKRSSSDSKHVSQNSERDPRPCRTAISRPLSLLSALSPLSPSLAPSVS